jgi:hypothetical protein
MTPFLSVQANAISVTIPPPEHAPTGMTFVQMKQIPSQVSSEPQAVIHPERSISRDKCIGDFVRTELETR